MAYMNQEMKAQLAPAIKDILKRYGLKGTLSVKHHMKLVLTITEGPIDFFGHVNANHEQRRAMGYNAPVVANCLDVYRPDEPSFTGDVLQCLSELWDAMHVGNWDKSDIMTDYFNVGWYVDLQIGRWNKPYRCTALV